MLLDFLEKREETVDTEQLTEEEKLFLKVFGIESDQPAAAMKEATYFTCIKKLSEAVAKTPLYLVQETETGQRRAKEDPLYELLSLRPNPYMTAVDFWKAIEATRQHEGISAAVKQYGRKGEILALYPCTVEGITIDDAGLLKSKLRHKVLIDYRVTGSSVSESSFYEDLLIFKGFTMDGINTKPVREIVKSTIEGQIKAQNYLNSLFDNGLTNKMVVQLTSDIKEEKELRKIQDKFTRLYSKGKRIFTVPAGFSVQPVNLSLADAQYEQIRRMSISQIAALFGIKMYQLNDLKDMNNNSLEQQQLSFLVDTLLIIYEAIEQEVTWSLLTKEKRAAGYKARHNTNVILRSSPEAQQKILCGYVAGGIIKPNEARLELGRETTPDGDDLIVNAGVLKLKDLGKDTKGGAREMPTTEKKDGENLERRNYTAYQRTTLEVRKAAEGEESNTIGGYAVKYNTPVLIVDRWGDKYLEEIAAGCFDESLNSSKEAGKEIKALWNHDTGRPLGSTKTDTLRFNQEDKTGLAYDIDLPNNTWGNDVKESVRRGDVDGSSFGFICQEDRWSKVEHEGEQIYKRSVVKAELLEVSPCTFPAYDSSEISCRSFERVKKEAKEESRIEKLKLEARLLEIAEENKKEY